MRRIARWLVHYSVLSLFAAAALSLLLAAQLHWLDVDLGAGTRDEPSAKPERSVIELWLRYPETDPLKTRTAELDPLVADLAELRGGQPPFLMSSDGRVRIFLFTKAPRLRRAELARRLSEALAADDPLPRNLLVAALLSPTLARAVWASQPGPVQDAMGDLAGALEQIPDAVGRAAHRLLHDPGLRRVVVHEAVRESRRREAALVDAVARVADKHRGRVAAAIEISGPPVRRVRQARRMRRRAAWTMGASLVVVAVVVLLALRRVGAVAAALGAGALSGLWTLGLTAWIGVSVTWPAVVVGPVLLGVSASFALHILAAGAGASGPLEAAERGLARAFLPVLLAGNVLVAGGLWLALREHQAARALGWPALWEQHAMRDLGLVGVMGTLCAIVVALVVVPGLARWLRPARASRPGTLAASLALAATLLAGGLAVSVPGEASAAQVRLLAVAFGVVVLLGLVRCLLWEKGSREGPTRALASGE
ncbi:MAG: hypothetical protein ACOC8D_01425 [bacterium]